MRIIRVFFLCSLIIVAPAYAQQTQLLSMKYWKSIDNQVEVDFMLTDNVDYKTSFLKNPSRFVIDFSNVTLAESFMFPTDESTGIERVRSSQRGNNDLRLVFDYKLGTKPKKIVINTNISKKILLTPPANHQFSNARYDVSDIISVVEDNVIESKPTEPNKLFSDWEVTGKLSIEELGFFHTKLDPQQHANYISGAIEPEFYKEWDGGKQSFTFKPFFRYDQHDNKRTHFDIRELTWDLAEDDWELRVGFRKVFWGVAEGLHLVDIINQTDLVENTDTEDKLGQPMINLALIRDWGTLDLFVMPGFRERTFSGKEGRFRSFPEVSVGEAEYDRHGIEKHMAYAVRWSQVFGDWDVGLSHFYGMGREPSFKPKITPSGLQLIPFYELINQTGLDIQLTHEDWILKHEGILRSGQGNAFYAMTTGVEYTLFDLFSSGLDLGFVVEYMYDTRGSNNMLAPFQDDILTALRFALNDVQSTEILAGVMFDRTNNTKFYNIEASRRLGDSFKIEIEVRLFSGAPDTDPSYILREDDHIRMEIGYYF